ncbi:MAG: alkaline phosphatase family protein [Actinomycetota bacterium]|nr:alkaline phosphatase family protein [Actinomycetota bacterium]
MKVKRLAAMRLLSPAAFVLIAAVGGGCTDRGTDRPAQDLNSSIVERACRLPKDQLLRIWRGHDPDLAEDITYVPREPNFIGTFDVVSHTGPWDYVQEVPLVFYGPGFIRAQGAPLEESATLADVYPTVETLLHTSLPPRHGTPLADALAGSARPPRVIATIVWDGAGRNVLSRWPDRWPTLARLEREGTSYLRATVGSSPSITPATHSTLGTGAWPRRHGAPAIKVRRNGHLGVTFDGYDGRDLRLSTFADAYDREMGNESQVGLVGWQSWHIGMLGRGAAVEGADKDLLGIIRLDEKLVGNDELYETPPYLRKGFPGLEARVTELDRADGRVDGEWLGDPILGVHQSPAWVRYESDVIMSVLKRERFGLDEVPDLFFANFKMTDIAGHQFGMDSQRMAENLQAQDEALDRLIDYLERRVHDYVVIVTADHGHTPPPERSGGWPISQQELIDDLNDHFEVPSQETLVQGNHSTGLFLDSSVADDLQVHKVDVARFINSYTLADNWSGDDLPNGYGERGGELLFSAAYPSDDLDVVMDCAFRSE